MRPQTFTNVPSTRKPSSLRLRLQARADEPQPTYAEFKKITRTQRSRARTRQSAALSGLGRVVGDGDRLVLILIRDQSSGPKVSSRASRMRLQPRLRPSGRPL